MPFPEVPECPVFWECVSDLLVHNKALKERRDSKEKWQEGTVSCNTSWRRETPGKKPWDLWLGRKPQLEVLFSFCKFMFVWTINRLWRQRLKSGLV